MNESGRSILNFLSGLGGKSAKASDIAQASGLTVSAIMSLSESLAQEGLAVSSRVEGKPAVIWLNAEGRDYYANGAPERRLCNAVKKSGHLELDKAAGLAGLSPAEKGIAFKWVAQERLLAFEKKDGKTVLKFISDKRTPTETALEAIGELKPDESAVKPELVAVLRSRRLLERRELPAEAVLSITEKGLEALKSRSVSSSQLTPEMLKDGKWKDARFRPYDLNTAAAPLSVGRRHHYLSFVRRLKSELASMGFQEARGPLVELEFWNMDVLFMPQDHPARDIHDVFALDIGEGRLPDAALVERVKNAHSNGLAGSKGWGYQWSESLARRLVMRSQTTSVSARTLAGKITLPFRMFCIGRVFRPDEIDWKHFIEFNQCEGIVCDENMSFRELLGYLKTFAVEVFGADEVKFAPSYFPFTEPSVEMYTKVEGKWTEVGGAGMFRPEMLSALGCKVPVLAWGLGLDRLAMKKLGISDIRDLYSQDIQFLGNR
ncbi:MAG: phenylalanine--tRNA ligase subunit alpha [Candidatus Micrarchaeota archaeon]